VHVPGDLPVRAVMQEGAQLGLDGMAEAESRASGLQGENGGGALTGEQEQAVARRGEPLLLSAAAGSGKTSVLVERFVRAVREDGLAPGKILAITFTDRAAGELRERVRARLLQLGEREAARDAEAAFVGTFHGFCARLLRAHPLMAGLEPEFTILDDGLAGRLRGEAFTVALRGFLGGERTGAVDLIAAYGVDRVRTMIEGVHAQLRSRGERLPRLPAPKACGVLVAAVDPDAGEEQATIDAEAAAACGLVDELLAGFTGAYEALKRERGAVDFDDLELCARELLDGHESVRAAWSERFELLMVDEFQDTNPRQLGILRALDRANLFTVGDEHQSIYGFRHADVSLFRERREELAGVGGSLALTRNFRSRPALLELVNAVFEERFEAFTPLVAARDEPPGERGPLVELLLTARGGWEQTGEVAERIASGLPPAPLWRQAEARMLARQVSELVQGGRVRAGEVVVLLRALGDVEVYERALQLCGLQTLAAAGAFWEHQQIDDLLAYLRTLANPLDEEALYGTLASPLVGLSRDGLALLAGAARAGRRGAWETASRPGDDGEALASLSAEDRDALAGFCARMRGERESASLRTLSELIERAIESAGYREHALALRWGERRLANVHKLLRLARRFEADEGRDLRAFLDHVAHLKAVGGAESHAPVDGVEPDAVRLMSIHAAKGLEFAVVCVADLGRAQNTRMPDLLVDGDRIGLQLVRLDGARATAALDYGRLREERRRREAEEEDRILYVAMTRARERLVLSGAVDFERWPEQRQGGTTISWLGPTLAAELPLLVQAAAQEPGHDPVREAAREPGHEAARETAREAAHGPVHELRVGPSGAAVVRCVLNAPASGTANLVPSTGAAMTLGLSHSIECVPSYMQGVEGTVRVATVAHTVEEERQQPRQAAALSQRAHRLGAATTMSQMPPTLSYSSLSELERCGYRFYLERVLGLPEDRAAAARALPGAARSGLEARTRGTLVHRLLEDVDFTRPRPPSTGDVERVARELGMRLEEAEGEEIAALIEGACASELAVRVAGATGGRREHSFAFSVGERQPLIVGVIDLLAEEGDGGLMVLDYKSDRVGPDVDLDALVRREYGVQRLLYALAVLREGAASVEVVHWFLQRPHDWVGARYAAAERGELEERLQAFLRRAHGEPFEVARQPHRGLCLTCPGRVGLCSWSEAETLREDTLV
jgi:ATP-dependent helicase/nuclease subunit A